MLYLVPEAGVEGQTGSGSGHRRKETPNFLKSNHTSSQCRSAILKPQLSVRRSTASRTTRGLLEQPKTILTNESSFLSDDGTNCKRTQRGRLPML